MANSHKTTSPGKSNKSRKKSSNLIEKNNNILKKLK